MVGRSGWDDGGTLKWDDGGTLRWDDGGTLKWDDSGTLRGGTVGRSFIRILSFSCTNLYSSEKSDKEFLKMIHRMIKDFSDFLIIYVD